MKLEKFKEKKLKKKGFMLGIGGILLLLAGICFYRSFAIFEESQEFDVIKGTVPNQKYDVMLSYNIVEGSGNKIFQEKMPEGKNWAVEVECDHGASGTWDYIEWGPLIKNLSDSRTKCSLNFKKPLGNLIDIVKAVARVTSGDGLYEVGRSDANITYTSDATAINNLKQTELRYAGANPNNYVIFNDELWRVIGLVNTEEGSRVKIIRDESIGEYSWDSSVASVNGGYGVNEWSGSDLMTLLNSGAYYNRTSGTCYNGSNNTTTTCNFSSIGLTTTVKNMIETVTWNLGANPIADNYELNPVAWYSAERGTVTGKVCSINDFCNDIVERMLTWKGKVGLMYPSDYGYATSDRSCLTKTMNTMDTWNSNCVNNNWLYKSEVNQWIITPSADSIDANGSLLVGAGGNLYSYLGSVLGVVRPTTYLVSSVKVSAGDGSRENPFVLIP